MSTPTHLQSFLNHPLISERYFFPQRSPFVLEDALTIHTTQGRLSCWCSQIEANGKPLLVHFHGNGELIHHWIPTWTPWIRDLGYEILYVEYPGYGHSEGQPKLQAFFDDLFE